jgi:type II secretory pathway pseudopilin PulG
MENENIINYVSARLAAGAALPNIREELMAVGWSREEIEQIAEAALVRNGVPAPAGATQKMTGRAASTAEVAVNFFSYVLLSIVATALVTMLYQVINHFFPDPLIISYSSGVSLEAIRYGIATLVIVFPLYFLALRFWLRRYRADESRVESRLTKWLAYLALLVSAGIIVGDLITALFFYLGGEISARFFLKVIVLLVIAGAIFSLYFLERRLVQYRKAVAPKTFYAFAGLGLFLAVVSIILGFVVSGSPSTSRETALDDQRESDLRSISNCVGSYASNSKRLPTSLADLGKGYAYCTENLSDPVTGAEYGYRVVVPSRTSGAVIEGVFELCATFTAPGNGSNSAVYQAKDKWSEHAAGKSCDEETIVLEQIQRSVIQPVTPPVIIPVAPAAPVPAPAETVPVQ